jgi:hypothetical protein
LNAGCPSVRYPIPKKIPKQKFRDGITSPENMDSVSDESNLEKMDFVSNESISSRKMDSDQCSLMMGKFLSTLNL